MNTFGDRSSAVAMDADGDFVVAWTQEAADGNSYGVFAQQYFDNTPPVISDQMFSVNEQAPVGTVVGTVVASDADSFSSLTYSFSGGNVNKAFAIDSATGQITVARAFAVDFETVPIFILRVQATDQLGAFRKANITVNLNDINEQPLLSPQTFNINENSPGGTVVGTVIASDVDAGDTLTFTITGGNVGKVFAINATSGLLTVSKPPVDLESVPTYALSIQVTDESGLFRKAVMTINVNNVNEQPNVSPQTFNLSENAPNGTAVGNVIASDPDTGSVLTYSITGGNVSQAFTINSATGQISVNNSAALDFETRPTFSVTVQVTDQLGLFRKAVMTINLNNVAELIAAPFTDEDDDLFSTTPSLLSFAL